jgi:hypothetical protein
LGLASLRGREAEFAELIRTTVREAEDRGEGIALTTAEFLTGGPVQRARPLRSRADRCPSR